MNSLLLGVVILVGAPGPKDPPKKDTGIVGEWIVESISTIGKPGRTQADGTSFEFTADGQWLVRHNGVEVKQVRRYFKEDPKASPRTFDVYLKPPGEKPTFRPNMLGIYKVEGDTLTIVFGEERPLEFVAPAGGVGQKVVLKRAKKDEANPPMK